MGGDIAIRLVKEFLPYLLAFVLGLIVAWKGCGGEKIETIIKKPVATIEYVDRWRTDTVRFVSKKVITQRDTIYNERIVNRLDTLFLVDTISIVEAWLTELVKYDTTVNDIRLTWQNYQNRTENLNVTIQDKNQPLKFALGVHGLVGLQSDFVENYKPLFGVGLQATIKKTYFSVNYGYNSQHFISVGIGRNLISK